MDKIKHIIAQNENKLKWVFVACLINHLICCYSRTDYNVMLYILLYFSWEPNQIGICDKTISAEERNYSYFLLLFTIILDVVWLIAFNNKSEILEGFASGMFTITFVLTIIGVIIKLILAFALGLLELDMLKNYLPQTMQDKINLQGQSSRKEIMME